jgi:aspartate ammonia-lyase
MKPDLRSKGRLDIKPHLLAREVLRTAEKNGQHQLHAVEPLIGHLVLTSVQGHMRLHCTAHAPHYEDHCQRGASGPPREPRGVSGLLEREEAMALLTPVPLRSVLLAGG